MRGGICALFKSAFSFFFSLETTTSFSISSDSAYGNPPPPSQKKQNKWIICTFALIIMRGRWLPICVRPDQVTTNFSYALRK